MRVGGCLVVVAQWQSTGGSTQRCPGFDSWPFHFSLDTTLNLITWLSCDLRSVCLSEKVRERVIALVGKAYSTVRVPEFCALMGKSEAEVRQSKSLVCICLLSDDSFYI